MLIRYKRSMRAMRSVLLLSVLLLTSCRVSVSGPQAVSETPFIMTATLALTQTPYAGPQATTSATPVGLTTGDGTPSSLTPVPGCKDAAVLLQDVTISDGTHVPLGSNFTKTWQFKNTGECPWVGYTIAFASGDRMGSPDSAPIPPTAPHTTVNVSINLVAPASDGIYTGYFEMRNADGSVVPIGLEKTFWVTIAVGNAVYIPPTLAQAETPASNPTAPVPHGPASCKYSPSPTYPDEIATLINNARTQAGLRPLTINFRLAAAAQGHSIDMACFGLLSHTGSDGSTILQRISAAGYPAIFYEEMIYASGYPQDAFNSWMNDPTHHAVIFDTRVSEMGVGYAYVSDSAYGGYYTVDLGSQ